MVVSYFTDEVPGMGRRGLNLLEISGRTSTGTRVMAGLGLAL